MATDGTVIAHVSCTGTWWKLTPNNLGSYVNGTWSTIATMPSGHTPRFFASAVLPDGRIIVEGGEYNTGCAAQWSNKGSIYDPVLNTWANVPPPAGWSQIGDSQATVLPNGTFFLANCCDSGKMSALLNASTLTWTATGTGKFSAYDEEGWTLLPNGKVLTVDAYVGTGTCSTNTEVYDPATGAWTSAGNTPSVLADCSAANAEGSSPTFEMGPQVLMYNGSVIAFGANTANTVHTALFNTSTNTWSAGPNLPSSCGSGGSSPCTLADAPATILPNGNVLFAASAGAFHTPTKFFEYSPVTNTFTAAPATADASSITSFQVNFVVLPTGQILEVSTDTHNVQIYTPSGTFQAAWQPTITSVPTTLAVSGTYTLSGTQLNGLSEGANYGDDQMANTNYPLVRITNNSSSHVFYARTFNHSSRSIAPGAASSTSFTVPAGVELGASSLVVVANGIPSAAVGITITSVTASLQVSPATDIVSSGFQFGPFSPSSFPYQLSASSGSVGFSISGIPTWLTASFTSGTVTTSPLTVTFTVNSNANTLTPSTYSAVIGFTNTTNNLGNTTRNATLTVNPLPPVNDNFANATIIHENQTLSGTNVNATKEAGEPLHNNGSFDPGGKSVWWRYTAALSGYVTVSTCGSSFDTVLAVYTGSAVNALTRVGSNDDFCGLQSQLKFNAVAGTTYSIVVDGFFADSGSITLSLTGPLAACEATAKLSNFSPDGRNDIAFQNDSGLIGLWQMNGASILAASNVGAVPAGWRVVASGDLNGDGHADLIFRHSSGTVGVWFLTNGSFVSATSIATIGNDWHIVGVADLNGDGMADIIWRHDSGAVGAWLMNGSSIVLPTTIASVGNDWRLVGLGDVSGDGKADFVWRHDSGTVGTWIMNSVSIASASNIAAAPNDWHIVAIGDLNGDGTSDIVWRNDAGTVGVWFLNGGGLLAPANIASVGTDWHVAAAGDLNADGRADIVWRHDTGTVAAWLMDGTTVLSSSTVASPGNDWHIVGGEHDRPPTSTGLGPC